MITKFKIFEGADRIDYLKLTWRDEDAYPFTVCSEDEEIYFGIPGDAHYSIDHLYMNDENNLILKDGTPSDSYALIGDQGRIWVESKIISFWTLKIDDVKVVMKKIQKTYNFEYPENDKIDLFDGTWQIEIDYDKKYNTKPHTDYQSQKKIIIPLLDFINDDKEIELDDEEYQQHLAKQKK